MIVDLPNRVYLTWLDVIYFALLGVAIALFQRARKGNYHNKYLDYRAVAEGLRVQFFWRLAGFRIRSRTIICASRKAISTGSATRSGSTAS